MAGSPSPPPQVRAEPPSLPPPPPSNPPFASRRLPPPCWSHDETVALIDSYRDKWYSLRRGNLKATHWQEVADAVAARCPVASPPKTSVQCRHKMEKLRKRYRNELQRSVSAANRHRNPSSSPSSWAHFNRMHSMEKGPAAHSGTGGHDELEEEDDNSEDEEEEEEDDDDDDNDLYGSGGKARASYPYSRSGNSSNGIGGGQTAFRIKFPGASSGMRPPGTGFRTRGHENPNPDLGTRVVRGFSEVRRRSGAEGKKRERESGAVGEMAEAVKAVGDGFVRMEKMKMEMAKELEVMRMEMEMKRTEMILESQQRIVEAFAKGLAEKK